MREHDRGLLLVHNGSKLGCDLLDVLLGNLELGVVIEDRAFDCLSVQVGKVADAFLSSTAKEVAVAVAASASCLCVDEARDAAAVVTTPAEEEPFQIVIKDAVALS